VISRVVLRASPSATEAEELECAKALLRAELGALPLGEAGSTRASVLSFSLEGWQHPAADILSLDKLVHQFERGIDFVVELSSESWQQGGLAALALLTRYQRLLPLAPPVHPIPQLTRVLATHRALHDLVKPLVRADYDHALDTWRWLLRLEPAATPALQLAALFHDVERLRSETDQRVEQQADDYCAFKTQHAKGSARMATRILLGLGFDSLSIQRTAELIAEHEQPETDAELDLLNDADALSFFSLNSWGYLRYFGKTQTRRKIAYTLARMSPPATLRIALTRPPPEIASMLRELLPAAPRPAAGAAHA
jgi:hypothetical protein